MPIKRLAILGSTGSIGVTTLDLVGRFPDRFAVAALAGGRNIERLAEQVRRFRPRLVATGDETSARLLRGAVPERIAEIVCGPDGLNRIATAPEADLVVSALVGALGVRPAPGEVEGGE